MNHFTYIFAGGGCAALSTALYMSRQGLKGQRLLIIDQDEKVSNDRTWCFWSQEVHPFQDLVCHSWPQLSFADDKGTLRSDMGDYQYHLIRGADFYQRVKAELAQDENVYFLTEKVENIYPTEDGTCVVWTNRMGYTADSVLTSVFRRPPPPKTSKEYNLLQHFKGWWIATKQPRFNPQEARIMDFSVEQKGDCRFMYVLPVSEKRALVEFTLFSEQVLQKSAYENALRDYIEQRLGILDYRIEEEEQGCIPMTNQKLSRFTGKNIFPIGTAAGWVKPSTGYAFLTIQKKSAALARTLLAGNKPQLVKGQDRFTFYDHLLLHILTHGGQRAKPIFSALFRHNPMHRILRFLDEQSSLRAELFIFGSLPFTPFFKALWQRAFKKAGKTKKPFFSISEDRPKPLPIGRNSERIL